MFTVSSPLPAGYKKHRDLAETVSVSGLRGGVAKNVGTQHGAGDFPHSCILDFFAQLPSGVLAAVKDMADVIHGAVALFGDPLFFRRP